MARMRAAHGLMLATLLGVQTQLHAATQTLLEEGSGPPAEAGQPPAEEDIRERLTEREDENRLPEPWSVTVLGHALVLSGQYEIDLDGRDQIVSGDPPEGDDRLLLEQEIETEIFYSLGTPLSFLAQARVAMQQDLLSETAEGVSTLYLERGETWVYADDLGGSGLDLEIGRLDFEDDRLWWWDTDLDAVRLSYEGRPFELAIALAYELGPTRSDRDSVDAEEDQRLRVLVELSSAPAAGHALEIYLLYDDDRSAGVPIGTVVTDEQADESDAELLWIGPRAIGGWALGGAGTLGYWVDTAVVYGHETLAALEEAGPGRSAVAGLSRQHLLGWALDLGATWFLQAPFEPRLSVGYARGSGDEPQGTDTAFRQTGLHATETSFGGVQRFSYYGRLLDPELSNLSVVTVGAGISFLESSSADLVYHYYRLVEPADSLRDASLETRFNGRDLEVGHGLDLVVAIEEGERYEIELSASLFRWGAAFGMESSEWAYSGFAAFRIAF